MNRESAWRLKRSAWDAAEVFSREEREGNTLKESFTVLEILPRSDDLSYVLFEKNNGKQCLALFYHVHMRDPRTGMIGLWRYFFLTDSHISALGDEYLRGLKARVELHNFPLNFTDEQLIIGGGMHGK